MEVFRQQYEQVRIAIENQVLAWAPNAPGGIPLGAQGAEWLQTLLRHHRQGQDAERALFRPELIYSYWLEEALLVQAWEAIALRFQNKLSGPRNALAGLDISPLRTISDLMWGYIDDQHRRLGLQRRALEYSHQYGLRLVGKAVGQLQPADDRSPFLQAFHTLLNTCMRFFREVDDRRIRQDARPVLNSLKELQMILFQGASNQFGTVPLQARVEMLLIQQLLGSQEIGRFLGGAVMNNYPEPWMDRVMTVRRLMGWGDTSIVEFWNLANNGEQILFTARWGDFGPAQADRTVAEDWALAFRNEISQYVHSYRAVSGVDLAAELVSGQAVDATLPCVYLLEREAQYQRRRAG